MSDAAPPPGRPATMSAVPANCDPPRRVVAAFDVDGTVTTRDCVVPFLRRVGGDRGVVVGLLARCGPLLAAGLLPAPLREAYGLAWRRRERALFAVLRILTRPLLTVLPGPLRFWPHYRVAVNRLRS